MAQASILYVDDEQDNLLVFKSALRRFFTIFTATSAKEALELLESYPEIRIIITDQRMPEMTGVQFLQQLPEEPETMRMILTGFSDIEAIIEAINTARIYKYITKPWDKDDLRMTIENAMEALDLRSSNKKLIGELQEANEGLEEKVKERTNEVEQQKKEIEELLLNILPSETAEELKKFGKAKARKYELVTVLFADIPGFTRIAERLSPEELVSQLDHCYRAFDEIIEKNGLEKIKTVGDAYICASGLPFPNEHNPEAVLNAALEMQAFMRSLMKRDTSAEENIFQLRVGIHSGPVVAGVVGYKKFSYDIWGDTVNIAARMEQHSTPGNINISAATHALVNNGYMCEYRGKLEAKNKGEIDMFFVKSALGEKVLLP